MTDDELLMEMMARTRIGHMLYYMPFNEQNSDRLRKIHAAQLKHIQHGSIFSRHGTLIASDFERVVIGDYGAFVEFSPEQANVSVFRHWFKLPSKQSMKYEWLFPEGEQDIKIYHQLKTVPYADYRIGYYYVSPDHIK